MYCFRFIFSFVLFAASFNFAQFGSWEWQNPKPTGADYNEAVIFSPSQFYLFGNGGAVTRTSNGGINWVVNYIDPQERSINAASFLNSSAGYVCGLSGMIYKTVNGFESWITQNSNTTQTLYGIYFLHPDTGFAVGAAGTLLKTVDGGTTWTASAYGTSTNYVITFLNSSVGFIGSSSATTGRLIKTTDGGTTWVDVSSALSGNTGAVRCIKFTNATTGWLSTGSGLIYKTNDAGVTWTQAYSLGSTTTTIYKVDFGDPSNGLAVTSLGRILRTVDGGANWLIYQAPTQKALYGLAALGSSAVVGGDAGNIFRTGDYGATFSKLTLAASQEQLQRASFPTSSTGYVVGGSITSGNSFGDILKTTNGGTTWTKLPFTPSTRTYSVCFLNEQTGYVGVEGPSGLHKTTDGGQTWTALNTGTGVSTSIIYDIDFQDNNTGYAAYASGQIAKTTDGGAAWSALSAGFGNAACYDIFIVNPTVIYALGPGGRISKSMDGGSTFAQLPSLGTATLYSMHFFSQDTGFIVGSSGKIWKTVDGGSFTEITSPVTSTIYVVRFANRLLGWFGASNGDVYQTTDGGTTWTRLALKLGFSQSIRDIRGTESALWVVGTDGMIIKLSDPIIPVELSAFSAKMNGSFVELNWTTASETNNAGFEVQKLINAEWNAVGFVPGRGTIAEKTDYSFSDRDASPGTNRYRLKQIDLDGGYKYSDIVSVKNELLPDKFSLEQNYPNPFNPVTKIIYSVPATAKADDHSPVQLKIFDLLGSEVAVLVNEEKNPGFYEIEFNAEKLPSGVYLYHLSAGGFSAAKKLILIK